MTPDLIHKILKLLKTVAVEVFHQLFLPIKKRYVIVFFASMFVFAPAAGLLFPKLETVLQKEGIPVQVIQDMQIDGQPLRVRSLTSWTMLHILLEKPFALFFLHRIQTFEMLDAFASKVVFHHPKSLFTPVFGCRITFIRQKQYDLERFGITDKQARHVLLLHEMRHCNKENLRIQDAMEREADADYAMLKAIETYDADLVQKYIHLRAMYICEDPYNNALYLDARLNAKTPLGFDEMKKANKEFLLKFQKGGEKDLENMSPLARKRAELFWASIKVQKDNEAQSGKRPRVISSRKNCRFDIQD